ncbi:MAG: TonB family protein [Kangiellaceae bacterium]|nr:TonB family protein [Kangiellaceae bacterium]
MSKLISIIVATGLSFLMFLGMTLLIKPEIIQIEPAKKELITFTYDDTDDEPEPIIRVPPKIETLEKPQTPTTVAESTKPTNNKPTFVKVAFNTAGIKGMTGIPAIWGGQGDSDAVPKVRINPNYPRVAATKGIEGFVTLTFDITKLGTTENIKIVEAQPRGVFNKEAKRALRKWRYQPKMEGNTALSQPSQRITLQFNLEKESI